MSYQGEVKYNTAAANTDVVITLTGIDASTAPGAAARHMIKQIGWSLTGEPVAAVSVTVQSPSGTTIESFYITKGGPGFMPYTDKGLPCALASNTIITLDLATDSDVTGKLSVLYDFA